MIVSFRHKGLQTLYEKGSRRGIHPEHAAKLIRMLSLLDVASAPDDLALPGYRLHILTGALEDHWSLRVTGNWRVTFRFVGTNVELVDYRDYH